MPRYGLATRAQAVVIKALGTPLKVIYRSVVRAPIVRKEGLVCRLIYEEKRLFIHKVVPPTGVPRER